MKQEHRLPKDIEILISIAVLIVTVTVLNGKFDPFWF